LSSSFDQVSHHAFSALRGTSGFEPYQNEVQGLQKMLQEEQKKATKAQEALMRGEKACRALERERDLFRLLSRRWESRFQNLVRQQGGDSIERTSAMAGSATHGMESLLRQIVHNEFGEQVAAFQNEGEMEEDSDDDRRARESETGAFAMEEDSINEDDDSDDDSSEEENATFESGDSTLVHSTTSRAISSEVAFGFHQQIRTVSMGHDADL
jgi:hypothetical protein